MSNAGNACESAASSSAGDAVTFEEYSNALMEGKKAKYGVSFEPKDGIDFGVVAHTLAEALTATLNLRTPPGVSIKSWQVHDHSEHFTVTASEPAERKQSWTFKLEPAGKMGKLRARLAICFTLHSSAEGETDFTLLRDIVATVARREQLLVIEGELKAKENALFRPNGKSEAGQKSTHGTKAHHRRSSSLGKQTVPKAVADARSQKHVCTTQLIPALEAATYVEHFSKLLCLEELQHAAEMRRCRARAVVKEVEGSRATLRMSDFEEGRHRVLLGDRLELRINGAGNETRAVRVSVCDVQSDALIVELPSQTSLQHSQSLSVRFLVNTAMHLRQLQVLKKADTHLDTLKSEPLASKRVSQQQLHAFKGQLRPLSEAMQFQQVSSDQQKEVLNDEQKEAVAAIVCDLHRPAPFLLFGPPGTGKTKTAVEAILQICRSGDKNAKILACAPSNKAADHLATQLSQRLRPENGTELDGELLRFNALSRAVADIDHDDKLKALCCIRGGRFRRPNLAAVKQARIIVATCNSSMQLGALMQKYRFSHVFVDEAAQATEPEALAGFLTVADDDTALILAGDPRQLGPTLHSREAKSAGLGRSLLERLMLCDANEGSRDPRLGVMLVNNYRSHESILRFSNREFYKNRLQPVAELPPSSIGD